MTEIEILPLAHDAQTTGFDELIRHIKSLPRNSTIMLEGTHQSFALIRATIEHTSGGKANGEHLRGKAKEMFRKLKNPERSCIKLGQL